MIKIVALVGKSASGKDAIFHYLINKYSNELNPIISYTTRPKRDYETEGVQYHFIDTDTFAKKIEKGEMLEASIFNEWCYGTSFDSLDENKINIGVFNPDGIDSLMQFTNIDLQIFYIIASNKTRLKRQLDREKQPNIEEIFRRYRTDEEDFDDRDCLEDAIRIWNETDLKGSAETVAKCIFGQKS